MDSSIAVSGHVQVTVDVTPSWWPQLMLKRKDGMAPILGSCISIILDNLPHVRAIHVGGMRCGLTVDISLPGDVLVAEAIKRRDKLRALLEDMNVDSARSYGGPGCPEPAVQ